VASARRAITYDSNGLRTKRKHDAATISKERTGRGEASSPRPYVGARGAANPFIVNKEPEGGTNIQPAYQTAQIKLQK